MLPFTVQLEPGVPPQHSLVLAAKRAVITGQLRDGDPFPSVRRLSESLKVNPNTAQKAVARLKQDGILTVRPGIGTVVSSTRRASATVRNKALASLERWIIEAQCLGIDVDEVHAAVDEHWQALAPALLSKKTASR